jgi:hypothetical protein
MISPTEAMEQWGVAKSVLYRDMKSGKLSYQKAHDGKREIDPAEMLRVYGPAKSLDVPREEKDTFSGIPDESLQTILYKITNSGPSGGSEVEALKDHIATLKEQLREKDRQLEKKDYQLEARNNEVSQLLTQVSEMSHRLLPAPVGEDDIIEDDEPEPEPMPKRKWWQLGRKRQAESVE